MIIGWLMKRIFVDKRTRNRTDARRKTAGKAAAKPNPQKNAVPQDAHQNLLRETMALYRQKRMEYEKLDSGLRGKFEKVVREAFDEKKQ